MDNKNRYTMYFACTTIICMTILLVSLIFSITYTIKRSQDIQLEKYKTQYQLYGEEVNTNE